MLCYIFPVLIYTAVALALIDAPVINDEPPRASWQAQLQSDKPVNGFIEGVSNQNGTGVSFNINFYDFPANQGPFEYHIHEFPVPADGNCSGTGGHFDPYGRTESPPCDANQPQTCQLGDLSGKHGNITHYASSFQVIYVDLYLSTQPGALAFFGNRSVVVHNDMGVRINCGNFSNVGSAVPSATAYTATALPSAAASASSAMSSASQAATGTTPVGSIASQSSTSATSTGGAASTNLPQGILVGAVAVVLAAL